MATSNRDTKGHGHNAATTSCGFTLIETMAALALMSIFALFVGSFTHWQLKNYKIMSQSFMTSDTARGVIAMLRDDAHLAGYGFSLDADAYGYVPTGDCTMEGAGHVGISRMLTCTKRNETASATG